MERELALGTVLTPKKETVARLSMQRGVRDGTLGPGLGRRPISAGRLEFPAPENDFYWVWS
jgi:hypothetical protein